MLEQAAGLLARASVPGDAGVRQLSRALERVKQAARKHLAFYGSTPAYRSTLVCHGWEALHAELNRLSKAGRWDCSRRRWPSIGSAVAMMSR